MSLGDLTAVGVAEGERELRRQRAAATQVAPGTARQLDGNRPLAVGRSPRAGARSGSRERSTLPSLPRETTPGSSSRPPRRRRRSGAPGSRSCCSSSAAGDAAACSPRAACTVVVQIIPRPQHTPPQPFAAWQQLPPAQTLPGSQQAPSHTTFGHWSPGRQTKSTTSQTSSRWQHWAPSGSLPHSWRPLGQPQQPQ